MFKYHAGERAVQEKAGVRTMAERLGPSIHAEMPAAAQEFLRRQPFVIIGYADAAGDVWASALLGAPGFASASDPRTVTLQSEPSTGDPLRGVWKPGTAVGLLAIEPASRRRMRINGSLARSGNGTMTVAVREAYANCPKYIQAREWTQETAPPLPAQSRRSGKLRADQQHWITHADTFFIASTHPESGADASHRGGAPGFVRVQNDEELMFPDYSGNNMFNTLGNITLNPKSGLLFIDFATGSTLQLTGEAKVDWNPSQEARFPGAQRLVEFALTSVIETQHTLPLTWRFVEASPFNPS